MAEDGDKRGRGHDNIVGLDAGLARLGRRRARAVTLHLDPESERILTARALGGSGDLSQALGSLLQRYEAMVQESLPLLSLPQWDFVFYALRPRPDPDTGDLSAAWSAPEALDEIRTTSYHADGFGDHDVAIVYGILDGLRQTDMHAVLDAVMRYHAAGEGAPGRLRGVVPRDAVLGWDRTDDP
ncbi:hypothetical protein [Roseomonas genomospecies 6]|uniref:Uncharacterized protein n=1 Tax=Roseomonas genomospecies 6 TaxID=214106 RepID=A0A9W7TYH0_9PROT|nr:hypothetical protein [Roseomonas genomospecies 6]KAA0679415.1 hypothetical protein DS843_15830 [Roseomonas genomospecies 6]